MHGIYIHIPFCAQKCAYCDFLSFPGRHEEKKRRYLAALEHEIRHRVCGRWSQANTIFIGGGTPTTLTAAELKQLLKVLADCVDLSRVEEFTVEANPGTVDAEKLAVLKHGGVNRLSFGVQSFDEQLLKMVGRVHTADEAADAVRLARQTGFENINLDLMYGLPGQTFTQWKATIDRALELAPEHLSLYQLIPEEGTYLVRQMEAGKLPPIDEDGAAEWFDWQRTWLRDVDYHQYEISNYARPGFASKHNQLYWHLNDYLGLGLGATSWERPKRLVNTSDFHSYVTGWLENGQAPQEVEALSKEEQMSETVFMGLRMNTGLSLKTFEDLYHQPLEVVFADALSTGRNNGWLIIDDGYLKLSDQGRRMGNWVFELFIE